MTGSSVPFPEVNASGRAALGFFVGSVGRPGFLASRGKGFDLANRFSTTKTLGRDCGLNRTSRERRGADYGRHFDRHGAVLFDRRAPRSRVMVAAYLKIGERICMSGRRDRRFHRPRRPVLDSERTTASATSKASATSTASAAASAGSKATMKASAAAASTAPASAASKC